MRYTRLIFLLIFSLLLVTGCSIDDILSAIDKENDDAADPQTGTLKMLLTDAPADYKAVNIVFSEIAVHYSGDENACKPACDDTSDVTGGTWIIINGEEQTFNLLELSNGVTALLGDKELEPGRYTQIRIIISDAEVVIDSTISYPLTIPSGTLKIVRGFDIVAGEETELVVDFDAARSIHTTGKKGTYKLKPAVRLMNHADCGSISGTVTNPENLPIAYAIAGADTITSSYVNVENGKFTLGFLAEGTYEVAIVDTLGHTYTAPGTSVIVGIKTGLGDITLE